MSDNVIKLVPDTVGGDYLIPPDQVLQQAVGRLTDVVVIGEDEDGEIYIAASRNQGVANLLIDMAKAKLIKECLEEME